MCNIVIQYFCRLQNDHLRKSRYHLSACKDIITQLTVFSLLYISSMWLIYIAAGGLYLFIKLGLWSSLTSYTFFCIIRFITFPVFWNHINHNGQFASNLKLFVEIVHLTFSSLFLECSVLLVREYGYYGKPKFYHSKCSQDKIINN